MVIPSSPVAQAFAFSEAIRCSIYLAEVSGSRGCIAGAEVRPVSDSDVLDLTLSDKHEFLEACGARRRESRTKCIKH